VSILEKTSWRRPRKALREKEKHANRGNQRPVLVAGQIVLSAALLLFVWLVPAKASASWPQLGVSQSYRNFGWDEQLHPGEYKESEDITASEAWGPLQISRLRVIVPWDLAGRPKTDGRRIEFEKWLARAHALGAEPYVVFGPSEKSPTSTDEMHTPPHWEKVPTRLTANPAYNVSVEEGDPRYDAHKEALVAPTPAAYKAAIADFLATWGYGVTGGGVEVIGAWNEPNVTTVNMSIPGGISGPVFLPGGKEVKMTAVDCENGTASGWKYYCGKCPSASEATESNCGPMEAAWLWRYAVEDMAIQCGEFGTEKECKVVAGEFDSSPAHTTSTGTWKYWNTYANKITKVAGSLVPAVISFHAHRDAEPLGAHGSNDCEPTGANRTWCVTYTFRQWLNGYIGWSVLPSVWNTETGAQHAGGSYSSNADTEQNHRFNQLISLSEENAVKRLYYFNFQSQGSTDRGWIDEGENVNQRKRTIWTTIKCRPTMPAC
jgi:hypothetical protein